MWKEYRLIKNKNIRVWKIRQDGERYYTSHGLLDGAMQEFSDVPGPKGKEGTKAFVGAIENCLFHMSREVRRKEENGYVEYIDGQPVKEQITSIDFSKYLPKQFTAYKPKTSIELAALIKLHKTGKARYTRKYDGNCHIACKHNFGWEIYTRRMDLATEKFPLHIELLNKLDLGLGTILVVELVCFDNNGIDNFKSISRLGRSDPEAARKLIEDGEVPEPNFIIFDILFFDGADLQNSTYDNRRAILEKNIKQLGGPDSDERYNLIDLSRLYNVNPDTWQQKAKDNKWEGYVVVDGSSIPKDKFYSYDGKPERPNGHFKLKPIYEDDVVVYAGLRGSGKNLGKLGSLFIKQIHPQHSIWFRCGKCAGISEADYEELEQLMKEKDIPIYDNEKEDSGELDDTGIVISIEYSGRYPKTNAFRFPEFLKIHENKGPKECIAQKLADEDE